jgi:hypothetical protein
MKFTEDADANIVPVFNPAMSTNVGMIAGERITVQEKPLVHVIVIAVIALVAYFGYWKRRL